MRRWADEILTTHGPPDWLINCAAVIHRLAPLWQLDEGEALALELPAGLGVVALNPGLVDTTMLHACLPEIDAVSPGVWARMAAPRILRLGPQHNGLSIALAI